MNASDQTAVRYIHGNGTGMNYNLASVVDPKLFFSDSDLDPL
jgi:hypothetical protein